MTKLPLRPNVCMLIFNGEGNLFLGERYGVPGEWQFPQGGVNEKYSLEENVLRELEEELGADRERFEIVKKLRATHEYEWDAPPSYAKSKWRGQKQSFYLVSYKGDDSEIDFEKHDQEFMNWRWCSVMEVRELADPRRMKGYVLPLREFEDYWMLRDTGLLD